MPKQHFCRSYFDLLIRIRAWCKRGTTRKKSNIYIFFEIFSLELCAFILIGIVEKR